MKPITIGHLDTGACSRHPALQNKIGYFIALDKNGFTREYPEAYDSATHGTHTAAIICKHAAANSTGPGFTLNVVSIPEHGKTMLNLLTAMNLLLERDIHIACMPIGVRLNTPVFTSLLETFLSRGTLVVAPIGNNGKGNFHAPGCYPGVLSVGAVNDYGSAAKFSGSLFDKNGQCIKPDIMAPGVNIVSAAPGNKTKKRSGTSMACACVAGIAAQLWQSKPSANAEEIKTALLNTTRKLPPGQQNRCRTGIADLEKAMSYLVNPSTRRGEPCVRPTTMEQPSYNYPYIDSRFQCEYNRAKPGQILEAVISPPAIIPKVSSIANAVPGTTRRFKHADMAYIGAKREFFDALLIHPELLVCSAVDISIFDF